MSLSRISSRFSRMVSAQCRNSSVVSTRHHPLPVPSNQFHSLVESRYKVVGGQVSPFHHSLPNASAFQRFGFSSVPSPVNAAKENSPAAKGASTVENNGAKANTSGDAEAPEQREAPICEEEMTMEDLMKLVTDKEELLKVKHEEIEKMQDKVLRSCANMVDVVDRARLESQYARQEAQYARQEAQISSRLPRIVLAQCRNSSVISTRHHPLPVPSSQFHSLGESRYKVVGGQVPLFHHSLPNASAFQLFGFSSVPSPENPEKENSLPGDGGSRVENSGATTKANSSKELTMENLVKLVTEKIELLNGKHEEIEKMVKLVIEKEELLKVKHEEIEKMQDEVLRTCADTVNVPRRQGGGLLYYYALSKYL
ncbi:hypothetical protein RHGRI_009461 [Rhododendron griersonianum]|uniref:Uncharacterized protein n=1 Tax=Rhododendron griersonianum TaxID=479676 RepID=A0AAV6KFC9_9ERIC|nr:hypothetical protein RHGRI_009461 [Rhododendron griersonianum]